MFENLTFMTGAPRGVTARNFYGAYLVQDTAGHTLLKAKMYVTSTYATNICCLWLHLPNGQCSYSYGKAHGYGYDRESTALVNALVKAGVDKEALRKAGISGGMGTQPVLDRLMKLWGGDLRSMYIGE